MGYLCRCKLVYRSNWTFDKSKILLNSKIADERMRPAKRTGNAIR